MAGGNGQDATPRDAVARSSHLVAGDPLRTAALFSVIVFHVAAGVLFLRTGAQDFDAAYGQVGAALVQAGELPIYVFFSLSGYLIARPWVAAALGRRSWPDPGHYAIRRVLRIVPAFWVACGIVLAIYGLQGSSPRELVALLTFGQVYAPGAVGQPVGHAWSLDVEMVFYAVLPVGALLAARLSRRVARGARARALVAAAVVLGIAWLGFLLRDVGMDPTPAVHSPAGVLRAFLPGVGLAVADVLWGSRLRGWRPGPAVAAALGLTGVAICVLTLQVTTNVTQLSLTLGTVAGGLLVAAPIVLQRSAGRAWRGLDNRVMHWLGERSYSIFLLHGIPVYQLRSLYLDHGDTVAQALALSLVPILAVTVAAAWVLHRLVEVPCMALARRLTQKTSGVWGARGTARAASSVAAAPGRASRARPAATSAPAHLPPR